jgi:asparagine synthetase B (glutamine-hydrolysing)
MCGIAVTLSGRDLALSRLRHRGPDYEGHYHAGPFHFVHCLLHVTGQLLRQPIVDDEIVCLFNGEIYGREFKHSDGELLIPLYRERGIEFARELDGEFAIALYDFHRERVIFASDAFGTKPLWTDGATCASYPSIVGGERLAPNTTLVKSFAGQTLQTLSNRQFEFGCQEKTDFNDWIGVFRSAVRKRALSGCYIGLSSGYDSGAIACELLRQGVSFASYGIRGDEAEDVFYERLRLASGQVLPVDADVYRRERHWLKTWCEPYNYHRETGLRLHVEDMRDDSGAIGASLIHRAARADGRRVYLSGQGADEILADYALTPTLSEFHGVFPERLHPWRHFQGGCQLAYLTKEEFVAGAWGVEGRYPFLDADLVQEFLWLEPSLKNSTYKAPLHEYLTAEAFPFAEGCKIGFRVTPITNDGAMVP